MKVFIEDAPSNIATSNLFQAMQPGYEYRNSNFINNLIDKSGFDLSGNLCLIGMTDASGAQALIFIMLRSTLRVWCR
jgi:hypothetical protein